MKTISAMKRDAKDLLECLQYEEALKIYNIIYDKEKDEFTRDDYINYIICLRMCNKNERALSICKDFYMHRELYENDKTFNHHNQLFAAILYDCYIVNFESWAIKDEDRFFNAVDTILSVVSQEESYSYESAVFRALEYLSKKVIRDVKKMYNYLSKVNPEKLSEITPTYLDQKGRVIEVGGSKEKWNMYYAIITGDI
ncbi:hypothetical protein [Clostridium tunisiense]|uniref:hypothetical protein n=1 Tax=Clostridium tunisiense TaxID=219748 RepID=UPI00031A4D3A|nr:hypothetical protein [Clostridium tunisiense]